VHQKSPYNDTEHVTAGEKLLNKKECGVLQGRNKGSFTQASFSWTKEDIRVTFRVKRLKPAQTDKGHGSQIERLGTSAS